MLGNIFGELGEKTSAKTAIQNCRYWDVGASRVTSTHVPENRNGAGSSDKITEQLM